MNLNESLRILLGESFYSYSVTSRYDSGAFPFTTNNYSRPTTFIGTPQTVLTIKHNQKAIHQLDALFDSAQVFLTERYVDGGGHLWLADSVYIIMNFEEFERTIAKVAQVEYDKKFTVLLEDELMSDSN